MVFTSYTEESRIHRECAYSWVMSTAQNALSNRGLGLAPFGAVGCIPVSNKKWLSSSYFIRWTTSKLYGHYHRGILF